MVHYDSFDQQPGTIRIQRLANGWQLTMPVNYPPAGPVGVLNPENFKDVMLDIASQMQSVKEPILREAEEGKRKSESEQPASPLIGYVHPKNNVFLFHTFPELITFLQETVIQ